MLQQLGLKEYEAKSFVALSRLPQGTAKEISEISEVPRTRVYDSIRVLETKGLVESHQSSPQQFRAVSVDEVTNTLKTQYVNRTEKLRNTLNGLEPAAEDTETELTHEVWSMSGATAIANRSKDLITEAEEELVIVLGQDSGIDDQLIDVLEAAQRRGVSVVIGTVDEPLRDEIERMVPNADVFVSGLSWLRGAPEMGDDTQITRLLLVDRSTILVSSVHQGSGTDHPDEQAVFGRGFDNGLVAIVRRLMATGLLPEDDPDSGAE
ncbi:TrmB family transcriptional regulator [Halovenus sp. WSH3]|uniref:TrmB family transcriptional regulator n=1 Tax=Halovenus carboxidivorans TaxID=2692199 RepID=A0A6B0TDK5_9EURY|nr:TrmB family transcriptional regulator [Halovenus carboxidivorans]